MNFWIQKKYIYLHNLNNVLENNNFFIFWKINQKISQKLFINLLKSKQISTFWIKKKLFKQFFIGPNWNFFFKNQGFFSYFSYNNNFINLNDLYKVLKNNDVEFLGILVNHNLFLNSSRFKFVKNKLDFIVDAKKYYLILLKKLLKYRIKNCIFYFQFIYLLLYKKNFKILSF